jgi:hypothetical protein
MRSKRQISSTVDNWIPEEEMPPRAGLKVIKRNDPRYGLTEDEIQDRKEFIRCHLLSEFELLTTIPKQDMEDDFFIPDCDVTSPEYSAFNTHDFQRQQRPFNKYHYAMKKIVDRVKDLAIMHSSISFEEGRRETHERYEALLEREFRDPLSRLVSRYTAAKDEDKRWHLKRRIAELNRRILDCKRIWEQYAPPENWEP